MRELFDGEKIIYLSDNIEDLKSVVKKYLKYPFDIDMLKLLKKENKLPQEYVFLKKGDRYAFFTIYTNKMNIFTFGKWQFNLKVKVIGYPCSLSNSGYVTNDKEMMFNYIKGMKGAKLVLNVDEEIDDDTMVIGQTLPTCVLDNHLESMDDYMNSLRSSYRRRIKKAIKSCESLDIKYITDDSIDVYDLYLNTYNKSNYKLEKLEKGFFDNIDAVKCVFLENNHPRGFVLLKKNKDKLIFMLCGMDYNYDTTDLYYYMLYNIVSYAIENKCKIVDFGQTSEETKMKFGATLKKKYFYAHHTNKLLNMIAKAGKGLLEYKYDFPDFKAFKED